MLHHEGIVLIAYGSRGRKKNREIEAIYTLISLINDLVIITG